MSVWIINARERNSGRDLTCELVDRLFHPDGFKVFDVPKALAIAKEFSIRDVRTTYNPNDGRNHIPMLRYNWANYYDGAKLLIADFVVEFYRTGALAVDDFDRETDRFTPKNIRKMNLPQRELDRLIHTLQRMQDPKPPLNHRWGDEKEPQEQWEAYIGFLHDELVKNRQKGAVPNDSDG